MITLKESEKVKLGDRPFYLLIFFFFSFFLFFFFFILVFFVWSSGCETILRND